MEPQVIIAVPAGMRDDIRGTPEIISRQEWPTVLELMDVLDSGIGFGFELKGPRTIIKRGFSEISIDSGISFGVHLENDFATNAWRAHQDNNARFLEELNDYIKALVANFGRRARYFALHSPRLLTEAPPITKKRYRCTFDPMKLLEMAKWFEEFIDHLIISGLTQVQVETPMLAELYGPLGGFDVWIPVTSFTPKIGGYRDLLQLLANTNMQSPIIDLEHSWTSHCYLHGTPDELTELGIDQCFADMGRTSRDFFDYFGFALENGCTPHVSMVGDNRPWPSWTELVKQSGASVFHIGGIGNRECPSVQNLSPDEKESPELEIYQRIIRQRLSNPTKPHLVPDQEYALDLALRRRSVSHAPIDSGDKLTREMLRVALFSCQAHAKQPFFVLEIANRKDGAAWWWAPEDGLQKSFIATQEIVRDLLN